MADSQGNGTQEPQTKAELERLKQAAVPMVGLSLGRDGRVFAEGRHRLGLASVVIEIDRMALLQVAAQLSMGALAALEAQEGLTS